MDYAARAGQLLRVISGGKDDLSDQAGKFGRIAAKDAKDITDLITRFVADLAETVAQRAPEYRADAATAFASARDAAKEQAVDVQRLLSKEVKNRPLQTLLLVAAAGIIIGWLSKR